MVWKVKEHYWPEGHFVEQDEEEGILQRLYGVDAEGFQELLNIPFTISGAFNPEYEEQVDRIFGLPTMSAVLVFDQRV